MCELQVPSALWLLALPGLHCWIATIFLFTSLLAPFLLRVVARVSFDPDVYMVNEGGNVTLILRTNVTVNKRFSVLVNTCDDSANSKYTGMTCQNRRLYGRVAVNWYSDGNV